MFGISRMFAAAAAAAVLYASGSAATVLTFDNLGLARNADIDNAYGDHSPGTPNIVVDYFTRDPATNAILSSNFRFWDTFTPPPPGGGIVFADSYGNLVDVAYAPFDPGFPSDAFAEIVLTPQPGFKVILDSFDLAGFPQTDFQAQIFVDYGAQSPLNLSGLVLGNDVLGVPPGAHSSFAPCVANNGPIAIRWSLVSFTVDFIAIDNLAFRQVASTEAFQCNNGSIPEPSLIALIGLGLAALAWSQQRRLPPLARRA